MSRSGNPYRRRSMLPKGRYCNVYSVCNSHICVYGGDTIEKRVTFITVIKIMLHLFVQSPSDRRDGTKSPTSQICV